MRPPPWSGRLRGCRPARRGRPAGAATWAPDRCRAWHRAGWPSRHLRPSLAAGAQEPDGERVRARLQRAGGRRPSGRRLPTGGRHRSCRRLAAGGRQPVRRPGRQPPGGRIAAPSSPPSLVLRPWLSGSAQGARAVLDGTALRDHCAGLRTGRITGDLPVSGASSFSHTPTIRPSWR